MRAEDIAAREAQFDQDGRDTAGKRHTLIPGNIAIPNSTETMTYTRLQPSSGDQSFYSKQRHNKDQIVLHFTMGYLHGDVAALTKPNRRVSTPFLIGRNGTIYNLFPSMYWSFHLGKDTIGGNQKRSKASIGIELSNIGPLMQNGSNMETVYSKPRRRQVYCTSEQNQFYTATNFRKYQFFATFTDAQYDSLIVLLRYLTARYGINRDFLAEAERFQTLESVPTFNGIVSHVNYRKSGKVDIGPAFDWQRLTQGVTA